MTAFELQNTVAENIRLYRTRKRLTQQKLAELADISVGYLCDLEGGKKWGTAETLVKLSRACNIEPYQLFKSHTIKTEKSIQEDLLLLSDELKKDIDYQINKILVDHDC